MISPLSQICRHFLCRVSRRQSHMQTECIAPTDSRDRSRFHPHIHTRFCSLSVDYRGHSPGGRHIYAICIQTCLHPLRQQHRLHNSIDRSARYVRGAAQDHGGTRGAERISAHTTELLCQVLQHAHHARVAIRRQSWWCPCGLRQN